MNQRSPEAVSTRFPIADERKGITSIIKIKRPVRLVSGLDLPESRPGKSNPAGASNTPGAKLEKLPSQVKMEPHCRNGYRQNKRDWPPIHSGGQSLQWALSPVIKG
jgi:hypothetical protein